MLALPFHQSYASSSPGAAGGYGHPIPQHANTYTLATQQTRTSPTHHATTSHYQGHHVSPVSHNAYRSHGHQDTGPISPYPELKDLNGPLLLHRQHHHHSPHHGVSSGTPPLGRHGAAHGHPPQHVHSNYARTIQEHQRRDVGLPDFPNQWVEDPREHHRPTYEQLLYSAWEHRHQAELQERQRYGGDLGLYEQTSDIQALNAALAGPQGYMIQSHAAGSPNQLLEPIRQLMEVKRAEAERVRDIAYQYEAARGHNDPDTQQAQEMALRAEAEAGGVLAVERALEAAPEGQGLQQIESTVMIYEEEKHRSSVAWTDARGKLGENHPKTVAARMEMLKAESAWQGASSAAGAPAQRGFEVVEHPQAVANRASVAADAYTSEAQELNKRAEQLRRKWGKDDPRVAQAQKEADEVSAKAQSALLESQNAQDSAEGKPVAKAEPKKKLKKKKQGMCF